MNKFSFAVFAIALTVGTTSFAATDIIRIDGTVFKAPDMRPASRVKDREHPTKARRAKVKETAAKGSQKESAATPKRRQGTTVLCQTVVVQGRSIIGHGCR